jgi:hypothetical protein
MIDKEARMADGARGGGTLIYSHGAELQAVAKICLGALSSRRNAARVTSSAFRFREAPGFEIHKILFY